MPAWRGVMMMMLGGEEGEREKEKQRTYLLAEADMTTTTDVSIECLSCGAGGWRISSCA